MWWRKLLFVSLLSVLATQVSVGAEQGYDLVAKPEIHYALANTAKPDLRDSALVWVEMNELQFKALTTAGLLRAALAIRSTANGPWVRLASKYIITPSVLGTIAVLNLLFSHHGFNLNTSLPLLVPNRSAVDAAEGIDKVPLTYVNTYLAEFGKLLCISGLIQFFVLPIVDRWVFKTLDAFIGNWAGRTVTVAFVVNNETRQVLQRMTKMLELRERTHAQ